MYEALWFKGINIHLFLITANTLEKFFKLYLPTNRHTNRHGIFMFY